MAMRIGEPVGARPEGSTMAVQIRHGLERKGKLELAPPAVTPVVERTLTDAYDPYYWHNFSITTLERIEAARLHPQALAEMTGKPEVASRTSQFAVRQDGQVVRRYDKNNASEEEKDWDRRYLRRRGVAETGTRAKLEHTRSMPIPDPDREAEKPERRIPSFEEVWDMKVNSEMELMFRKREAEERAQASPDVRARDLFLAPQAVSAEIEDQTEREELEKVRLELLGTLPPKEPQRPAEEESLEELQDQEEQASRPHNHGRRSSFWLKYGLNRADH